jgi:hypothetical protein
MLECSLACESGFAVSVYTDSGKSFVVWRVPFMSTVCWSCNPCNNLENLFTENGGYGVGSGWDSFLTFVQESVLNGSEEVAVAAIMSMHSVLVFHDLKVSFLGFVVVISDQFSFFWTLVWRFHI